MRLLPFLGSSSLLFLLQYFLSQGQSFFQLRLKIYFHFGAKKLLPKVFSHCPMVYSVNLFHVCDQNVEHSKTESDVWSYWKWSCLREGAWLCQDSPAIIFLLEIAFFWQPLYLLTKQKNIFTIFVNAEYPELRSEAANIIFQAPLKANEDDRSGVSHKCIFCHIMVLSINYTSVSSFLSNTNNLNSLNL